MLVRIVAVDVIAGLILLLAWYFGLRQYHRRRAKEVVRWIERAFHGHAELARIQWTGASYFSIQLRLTPSLFRDSLVRIQLLPREFPLGWLLARLRKRQEILTFQADLDAPPSFNLEVHNHRWYGRTRRRFPANSQNWTLEQAGPLRADNAARMAAGHHQHDGSTGGFARVRLPDGVLPPHLSALCRDRPAGDPVPCLRSAFEHVRRSAGAGGRRSFVAFLTAVRELSRPEVHAVRLANRRPRRDIADPVHRAGQKHSQVFY